MDIGPGPLWASKRARQHERKAPMVAPTPRPFLGHFQLHSRATHIKHASFCCKSMANKNNINLWPKVCSVVEGRPSAPTAQPGPPAVVLLLSKAMD